MTIKQLVNALVITTALLNVSACSAPKSKPAYPIGLWTNEMIQALNQSGTLKKAGKLPGFKADDHAEVKLSAGYKGDDISQPTFTFPIETTITAVKDDEKEFIYHYVFAKDALEASWRLVKAWKTSKDGAVLIADLLTVPAK